VPSSNSAFNKLLGFSQHPMKTKTAQNFQMASENHFQMQSKPAREQSHFGREFRMLVLAGAGGIEPPNGGIKIRCLTAWLRPNSGAETAQAEPCAVSSGNAGL
jgi:hypothetical protein